MSESNSVISGGAKRKPKSKPKAKPTNKKNKKKAGTSMYSQGKYGGCDTCGNAGKDPSKFNQHGGGDGCGCDNVSDASYKGMPKNPDHSKNMSGGCPDCGCGCGHTKEECKASTCNCDCYKKEGGDCPENYKKEGGGLENFNEETQQELHNAFDQILKDTIVATKGDHLTTPRSDESGIKEYNDALYGADGFYSKTILLTNRTLRQKEIMKFYWHANRIFAGFCPVLLEFVRNLQKSPIFKRYVDNINYLTKLLESAYEHSCEAVKVRFPGSKYDFELEMTEATKDRLEDLEYQFYIVFIIINSIIILLEDYLPTTIKKLDEEFHNVLKTAYIGWDVKPNGIDRMNRKRIITIQSITLLTDENRISSNNDKIVPLLEQLVLLTQDPIFTDSTAFLNDQLTKIDSATLTDSNIKLLDGYLGKMISAFYKFNITELSQSTNEYIKNLQSISNMRYYTACDDLSSTMKLEKYIYEMRLIYIYFIRNAFLKSIFNSLENKSDFNTIDDLLKVCSPQTCTKEIKSAWDATIKPFLTVGIHKSEYEKIKANIGGIGNVDAFIYEVAASDSTNYEYEAIIPQLLKVLLVLVSTYNKTTTAQDIVHVQEYVFIIRRINKKLIQTHPETLLGVIKELLVPNRDNNIGKSEGGLITYLKVRNDYGPENVGARYKCYVGPNNKDKTILKMYYNNNNESYYKCANEKDPNSKTPLIVCDKVDPKNKKKWNHVSDFRDTYDMYLFGPFSRIFKPDDENDTIADNMKELTKSINSKEQLCLITYGPSGSGKTSTLIYRDEIKSLNKPAAEGLIPIILNRYGVNEVEPRILDKRLESENQEDPDYQIPNGVRHYDLLYLEMTELMDGENNKFTTISGSSRPTSYDSCKETNIMSHKIDDRQQQQKPQQQKPQQQKLQQQKPQQQKPQQQESGPSEYPGANKIQKQYRAFMRLISGNKKYYPKTGTTDFDLVNEGLLLFSQGYFDGYGTNTKYSPDYRRDLERVNAYRKFRSMDKIVQKGKSGGGIHEDVFKNEDKFRRVLYSRKTFVYDDGWKLILSDSDIAGLGKDPELHVYEGSKHTYIPLKSHNDGARNGTKLGEFLKFALDSTRLIKGTSNNDISSRSHMVINITLSTKAQSSMFKNSYKEKYSKLRNGQLVLCDFAGVENKFTCENPKVKNQFRLLQYKKDPGNFVYGNLFKSKSTPLLNKLKDLVSSVSQPDTHEEFLRPEYLTSRHAFNNQNYIFDKYFKYYYDNENIIAGKTDDISKDVNLKVNVSTTKNPTQHYNKQEYFDNPVLIVEDTEDEDENENENENEELQLSQTATKKDNNNTIIFKKLIDEVFIKTKGFNYLRILAMFRKILKYDNTTIDKAVKECENFCIALEFLYSLKNKSNNNKLKLYIGLAANATKLNITWTVNDQEHVDFLTANGHIPVGTRSSPSAVAKICALFNSSDPLSYKKNMQIFYSLNKAETIKMISQFSDANEQYIEPAITGLNRIKINIEIESGINEKLNVPIYKESEVLLKSFLIGTFVYLLTIKNIQLHLQEICDCREKEGTFINASLKGLRDFVIKRFAGKGLEEKFIDECLPIQCHPTMNNCMNVNPDGIEEPDESGNYEEGITSTLINYLCPEAGGQTSTCLDQVKYCIFNNVNISNNIDDPPSRPYINVSNAMFEINRLDGSNSVHTGVEPIINKEKFVDMYQFRLIPFIRLRQNIMMYRDTIGNDADEWIRTLDNAIRHISSKEKITNNEKNVSMSTSIDNIPELKAMLGKILKFNASSNIGTLEFVDYVSKYKINRSVCSYLSKPERGEYKNLRDDFAGQYDLALKTNPDRLLHLKSLRYHFDLFNDIYNRNDNSINPLRSLDSKMPYNTDILS
jgi:hypothetical protein